MDLSEKDLQKLSAHPLFAGVSPASIRLALTTHGSGVSEFSDGAPLVSAGEQQGMMGFLLKGRATVTTADATRSVLLRFLSAGDVFGLASLFSNEAPVSRISASGVCKCILFTQGAVEQLLETDASFRKSYIGYLTGRIRFLNQKIGYLTAGSAERRLALYLVSLGTGSIRLQESITSLSDLLNLGRASLYRAFDRLCADGYLIKNGKELILCNEEEMLRTYQS